MSVGADVTGRPRPGSDEVEIRFDGDEHAAAEQLIEWGWTDGLPIVVPTAERVDQMSARAVHDPDESVGKLAPRGASISVRQLAANAVMAGCLPDYMPVLEAATAAIQEDMFNLFGMQTTTHPCGLLAIVQGPVTEAIGMNSEPDALVPATAPTRPSVGRCGSS